MALMKWAQSCRVRRSVTATGQWFDLNEQRGDTVAYVFVIDDLVMAGCGGNRFVHLSHQLLARLVHANNRKEWIMGETIDCQHLFHCRHKGRVSVGRDLPVFA